MHDDNYRNSLGEAKQDLLKDYFNHVDALARQGDRILDVSTKYPGGRRSWYLSVLFRTIQFYQEALFKLVLLKFPKYSNLFPTSFQTISNQIIFYSGKFARFFQIILR